MITETQLQAITNAGVNLSRIKDRFLKYIAIDSQANPNSESTPSSPGQLSLAQHLQEELTQLGIQDIQLSKDGYLYARIPGRRCHKKAPRIGFIAHLDTAPDAPGVPNPPQIIDKYDGTDIKLKHRTATLSPENFPELNDYIGEPIIVTDGEALLGADDKAGIAAIMEALYVLLRVRKDTPHPPLRIAFTTDEELGYGTRGFDYDHFSADFAYTVDGSQRGEIQNECFNAIKVQISICGKSVHPGGAKNTMVNALNVAHAIHAMIPEFDRPEHSDDRQGFTHLYELSGNVAQATMKYIVRDFKKKALNERIKRLRDSTKFACAEFGCEKSDFEWSLQYLNMRKGIKKAPLALKLAEEAIHSIGLEPIRTPIRGGTDGANLTENGLPTPNLFAGGLNFHGPYEYLPLYSLAQSAATIIHIITKAASIPYSKD